MILKKINGVDRAFELGMYTFKLIAEDTGVTNIREVFERLSKNDLPFMISIFFCCAKHGCKARKEKVYFTEDDIYDWADELGINGLNDLLSELIQAYQLKNQKAPATGQTETNQ